MAIKKRTLNYRYQASLCHTLPRFFSKNTIFDATLMEMWYISVDRVTNAIIIYIDQYDRWWNYSMIHTEIDTSP